MSIPKDIRFKVFWRDGFTCQYCGRKPPEVVLEIDHIVPRSKGGTDNIENLVTACRDCNRSKNKKHIAPAIKIEELKEKVEQFKAFVEFTMAMEEQYRKAVWMVVKKWEKLYGEQPSDDFIASLFVFVKRLPLTEIMDAVDITSAKVPYAYKAERYFFGVIWTKIKKRNKEIDNGKPKVDGSPAG